jgi:glutamyl-tRNA reductase
MAILALGVSHRRATVELLERLAFADADFTKAYRRAVDDPAIDEAVVLSTCNRIEIYGSVPSYHAGFQALKRLLCESREVDAEMISEPLYSHYEDDAAAHLFSVSAGLDSMVLGEPQILSQVREALRRSTAEGATGPRLTALFHAAARAGRTVRTDTAIGAAPDAFIAAGADLAAETLGGLEGKHALVVGAGHMSALALKHLRHRGVGTIRVVNRSIARARALAERVGAQHADLDALADAIADADIVISATGAAGIILTEGVLRATMSDRSRPLFVLDLAVPRDVDPAAAAIGRLHLVDIDGLREVLQAGDASAAEDISRAHDIVAAEVHRFTLRRRSERLAPLIHALRERGDGAVAAELERFRSELSSLTPDERAAVEALARGIVAKLLHDPIVRLKELSTPGTEDAHAKLAAELFGLEPPAE